MDQSDQDSSFLSQSQCAQREDGQLIDNQPFQFMSTTEESVTILSEEIQALQQQQQNDQNQLKKKNKKYPRVKWQREIHQLKMVNPPQNAPKNMNKRYYVEVIYEENKDSKKKIKTKKVFFGEKDNNNYYIDLPHSPQELLNYSRDQRRTNILAGKRNYIDFFDPHYWVRKLLNNKTTIWKSYHDFLKTYNLVLCN